MESDPAMSPKLFPVCSPEGVVEIDVPTPVSTNVELSDLQRAWGPINQENYAGNLARPDLDLQVVLAKRDRVVLPQLSQRFMQTLQNAGGGPDILELNCGHYSLALPPNILFAGLRLKRLLISDQ